MSELLMITAGAMGLGILLFKANAKHQKISNPQRSYYISRRSVDPLQVDKSLSRAPTGHNPAPHSLVGMQPGTGANKRNIGRQAIVRGTYQHKGHKTAKAKHQQLNNAIAAGKAIQMKRAHQWFGQGRPAPIGNDYKPQITTMSYDWGPTQTEVETYNAKRKAKGTRTIPHRVGSQMVHDDLRKGNSVLHSAGRLSLPIRRGVGASTYQGSHIEVY